MHTRFIKIRNILLVILLLNWLVAFAKVVYGFIIKSTAMSADGFHSFADGTSNIIGLIGIWVASQPQDKEHPYGHKKYETFAAIIIAIILFIIAFNIIRSGFMRFFNPVIPDVTILSFVVMFFTMAINLGVYLYEKKQARVLSSDILAADARHTRSDILVSLSVICTLVAVKAGLPVIDSVVSIFIAFLIARSGIEILKESSGVLCDKTVMDESLVKKLILNVEGVKDCHKIRTRGRRDDIHIDLHIMVDSDMPIGKAHMLNHKLEEIIKANIENTTDIAIHIEPFYSR
ncbi:cation transporter [bacterium]|nr:MAG: cation transporter [bacterium]